MRYFDNAATSYPKPEEVCRYISAYLTECGGTYGRGSYERALRATDITERCREALAAMMGTDDPARISFGPNATHGANTVLRGFDYVHKRVLISPLEHNAITRPLEFLRGDIGLSVEVLDHLGDGSIDTERLRRRELDNIDMVIICHQSNVNGLTQDIGKISEAIGGRTRLMTDLSQSLGHTPVDLDGWGVDFAAWTGHKGLLGPTGTGGCFIRDHEKVAPLVFGGTGSNSDSYLMPRHTPDKYEAGTPCIAAIAGLLGALEHRPEPMHTREEFVGLMERLTEIKGLKLICADDIERQGELFSIVAEGMSVAELNDRLWRRHAIECRSGLHCAPLAHRSLGTSPAGTVRVSLSPYHTAEDLDFLTEAIEEVCS